MTPLEIALSTLAVYRLSWFAREEGPFSLFAWVREKVDPQQRTWIGRGINCPACVGFWIAAFPVVLLRGSILDWLAIAGAAHWLYRMTQNNGA